MAISKPSGGGSEVGPIDLLTGGFPCQPFSNAGKRKGTEDDRNLWPEMLRVIREVHPRWVIGENVDGLITWERGLVLERILTDLAGAGYETQCFVIPAAAVQAPHRRDRIWVVAHAYGLGHLHGKSQKFATKTGKHALGQSIASGAHFSDTDRKRQKWRKGEKYTWQAANLKSGCSARGTIIRPVWCWATEPSVGRVAHGVPNRVDRIKSLGNAIVPQVAAEIMRAIKAVDECL